MRLARILCCVGLLAGSLPMTVGCGESTDMQVEKAPPVPETPPTPPPTGETKKFGGAGSSGSMNQNPGAST
jgi:hypothetical protein